MGVDNIIARVELLIRGQVQGVGFRPFVYRLATDLELSGFVRNEGSYVRVHLLGVPSVINVFMKRIYLELPPAASIAELKCFCLEGEFSPQVEPNSPSTAFVESISTSPPPTPTPSPTSSPPPTPTTSPFFPSMNSFKILESQSAGLDAHMPYDRSTCDPCLAEVFDPLHRRFQYPFNHCTDCGPRWSIVESLPYDRERTTYKDFPMCNQCWGEYQDSSNRRFHAQAISCPECGPQVFLYSSQSFDFGSSVHCHCDLNSTKSILEGENVNPSNMIAISQAAHYLLEGKIIALKGTGGFQLWAIAQQISTINELRKRKNRPAKPFAMMASSVDEIEKYAFLDEHEMKVLKSPQTPIVLLVKKTNSGLPECIASGCAEWGFMLPANPLQNILFQELSKLGYSGPVIATSGNLSGEPICIDNEEAFLRLNKIADYFLVHNRRIVRPLDDSVQRVFHKSKDWKIQPETRKDQFDTPFWIQTLRIGRGLAPLSIQIKQEEIIANLNRNNGRRLRVWATGGDLKSAVATILKDRIILSQHIGDIESSESQIHFEQILRNLYNLTVDDIEENEEWLAHDLHPNYYSTQLGKKIFNSWSDVKYRVKANEDVKAHLISNKKQKIIEIPHHRAHIYSSFVENNISFPCLALTWDGTGWGEDGQLWGGEFFILKDLNRCERVSSLFPFPLIGAEKAIKEPRRIALSLLLTLFNDEKYKQKISEYSIDHYFLSRKIFKKEELHLLKEIFKKQKYSPLTTSIGRLFDGISSLLELCQKTGYEGEAAIYLENQAFHLEEKFMNDVIFTERMIFYNEGHIDWKPLVFKILELILSGNYSKSLISTFFHKMLLELIHSFVKYYNIKNLIITGGCFQNRWMMEKLMDIPQQIVRIYFSQQIPVNDGGLAAGQIISAVLNQIDPMLKSE